MMRDLGPWVTVLPDDDRAVYEASGHGGQRGMGDHLALLLVDVQKNFLGIDASTVESARRYPTSVGAPGWRALVRMRQLLDGFRTLKRPVFFTQSYSRTEERAFDSFLRKKGAQARAKLEAMPPEMYNLADEVAPRPDEVVLRKCYASAFFGTPLGSFLRGAGVDTLIVCGLTTSGCVRATVVDAVSHNFNTVVAADACADRLQLSHRVSLLDMNMKYADVLTTDEVLAAISGKGFTVTPAR